MNDTIYSGHTHACGASRFIAFRIVRTQTECNESSCCSKKQILMLSRMRACAPKWIIMILATSESTWLLRSVISLWFCTANVLRTQIVHNLNLSLSRMPQWYDVWLICINLISIVSLISSINLQSILICPAYIIIYETYTITHLSHFIV